MADSGKKEKEKGWNGFASGVKMTCHHLDPGNKQVHRQWLEFEHRCLRGQESGLWT